MMRNSYYSVVRSTSLLLALVCFGVEAQTECSPPAVFLRYGLTQPSTLSPSTGSLITFMCVTTGALEFIWEKNGQVITGSNSNEFTISSLQANDGGVYKCGFQAPGCNSVAYSNSITLNTIPSITFLIGDSSVLEGGTISLSCAAQGWPTPSITWEFNGMQVEQSSMYIFPMATAANEGLYLCLASNTRGTATRPHQLSVIGVTTDTSSSTGATTDTSSSTVSSNQTTASTLMMGSTSQGSEYNSTGSVVQPTDKSTMGFTTGSTIQPEVPFVILLVVSVLLACAVVIICIVMGCLCCSEVCKLYKRKAKQRRDRLNSDEISLLPSQSFSGQDFDNVGENGYTNGQPTDVTNSRPSCVNMAFKKDANGSDVSAQNSTGELLSHPGPTLKQTKVGAQRYSIGSIGGESQPKQTHLNTDREQLIPQSLSMDDPQDIKRKKKKQRKGGVKSRSKSEAVAKETSKEKPRPQSLSEAPTQFLSQPSSDEVAIPKELPISEATLASLTVTSVIQAKGEAAEDRDKAGVGGASIVISSRTGETTVVMEQAPQEDVNEELSEGEWESSRASHSSSERKDSDDRMSMLVEKSKRLGRSVSFVEQLSRSHPMNVVEITQLVYAMEDEGSRYHPLSAEYQSIPSNSVQFLDLIPEEMAKNRYRNVLPNPHSRVVLKDLGVPGSSYINANHIRDLNGQEGKYIACQGPKPETIEDFWRMVWEQRISIIVMITGLVERRTNKCARYWPGSKDSSALTSYGNITVKNNFEEKVSAGSISYLSIYNDEGEEREVYHFWCTTWPDFGVPRETGSILNLQEIVDDYRCQNEGGGPLLVHCSAGLGRSGTFIAIDMGIEQYKSEGIVDPLKYVCEMRQDRGGIIQTPEQYIFVHQALADYMATRPQ